MRFRWRRLSALLLMAVGLMLWLGSPWLPAWEAQQLWATQTPPPPTYEPAQGYRANLRAIAYRTRDTLVQAVSRQPWEAQTVILVGWRLIAGESLFAARYLSAMFSLLSFAVVLRFVPAPRQVSAASSAILVLLGRFALPLAPVTLSALSMLLLWHAHRRRSAVLVSTIGMVYHWLFLPVALTCLLAYRLYSHEGKPAQRQHAANALTIACLCLYSGLMLLGLRLEGQIQRWQADREPLVPLIIAVEHSHPAYVQLQDKHLLGAFVVDVAWEGIPSHTDVIALTETLGTAWVLAPDATVFHGVSSARLQLGRASLYLIHNR